MKYVFICVDTQKDYTDKYQIPNIEIILPKLKSLTEAAKSYGVRVVTTRGWYKPTDVHMSIEPDYENTYPKHCIMGTAGASFLEETKPEQPLVIDWANTTLNFPSIHQSRNIVISKSDFLIEKNFKKDFADPFDGNEYFESIMHNLGITIMERPTYIIYGVNVGPTALGLMKRGYDVYVVNDANVNFNGMPLTKDDILKTPQQQQTGNGLLSQEMGMAGMEYQTTTDDTSLKFVTTDAIIG